MVICQSKQVDVGRIQNGQYQTMSLSSLQKPPQNKRFGWNYYLAVIFHQKNGAQWDLHMLSTVQNRFLMSKQVVLL